MTGSRWQTGHVGRAPAADLEPGEWEIPRVPLQYERAVLAGAVVVRFSQAVILLRLSA
ncbi:hypothetical protein ACWGLF_46055 [Streptomyces puniciscabiei]